MSQIEVDKVIPQSGTSLQLGENGDTISIPAGATFNASAGTFTLPDGSVVEAKIAIKQQLIVQLQMINLLDQ